MWKSGNRIQAPMRRAILGVAIAALAATLMGASKLAPPPEGAPGQQALAGEQAVKPSDAKGNQLRCWQYGRLIIDVHDLDVPPDSSAYTLTLRTSDRLPVYLVQSGTSTCLIQRPGGERVRPAPRK
jgi:hypothetical protein